jgi:hypothetical protein
VNDHGETSVKVCATLGAAVEEVARFINGRRMFKRRVGAGRRGKHGHRPRAGE